MFPYFIAWLFHWLEEVKIEQHKWYKVTDKGLLLRVRVVTRASKPGVQGLWKDSLKIRLKAPPIDGRANRELIGVLSKALGVPKQNIEIVRGVTGRSKEVLISGVKEEDLQEWQ